MKKQTKWPRPTHRVTRTTQIQGTISAFKIEAAAALEAEAK